MNVEHYYRSYYAEPVFERRELFRLIQQTYDVRRVLYPGCAIHLAASVVFPHVVYVDNHAQVARFFADEAGISAFLDQQKDYPGPPVYQFLAQDYQQPLPQPLASFDLLISQSGGLVSAPGKPYLRLGGVLLANDSHGDARAALSDPDYALIGTVHLRQGRYELEGLEAEQAPRMAAAAPAPTAYLFRRVA